MLTGKRYKITDFEDIPEFVNQELEKHGISPDSPEIDRKTGKKIYNGDGGGAANGSMWMLKLHRTAGRAGMGCLSPLCHAPAFLPSCYGHSSLLFMKKLISSTNSCVWKRKFVPCGQRESHWPRLKILESEAANYTTEQFSEKMYQLRPWYADRAFVVDAAKSRWNDLMGDKLPPASRLGWKPGELLGIDAEKVGRCPICGRMVHMPCYACALKEFLKHNTIPPAEEARDIEDADEVLPDLMFQ